MVTVAEKADIAAVIAACCTLSNIVHVHASYASMLIVCRDLKPSNVLWRPKCNTWVLVDFGCAARFGAVTVVRTHLYASAVCRVSAYMNKQKR